MLSYETSRSLQVCSSKNFCVNTAVFGAVELFNGQSGLMALPVKVNEGFVINVELFYLGNMEKGILLIIMIRLDRAFDDWIDIVF